MNNKIYKGKWFLENSTEIEINGNLTIYDNTVELDLDEPFNINTENLYRIFGLLDNGKKVTLEDCFLIGETFSAYGNTQKIKSLNCFIGEHFNSNDNFIIGMKLEISLLQDWVNIFNLKEEKNLEFINFYYEFSQPIKTEFDEFTIELNFNISIKYPDNHSLTLEQESVFYIDFREKVNIEKAMKIVFRINQLMTILIGEKTEHTNIVFYLNKLDKEIVKTKYHKAIYTDVVIPYGSKWISQTKVKEKHWSLLLTNFSQLKTKLSHIIKVWFSKEENIDTLINLFTSVYLLEDQFVETQFLTLSQALEAFHRQNRKNYDLEEKEFEEKITKIINSLPEEYKEEFREQLKYANEPNFNKRIKEILKETNGVLNLNADKRKSLAKKIKDLRNYYTHYDKNNNKNVIEINIVIKCINIMEILVFIILFKELSFTDDEMKIIFKKKLERINLT